MVTDLCVTKKEINTHGKGDIATELHNINSILQSIALGKTELTGRIQNIFNLNEIGNIKVPIIDHNIQARIPFPSTIIPWKMFLHILQAHLSMGYQFTNPFLKLGYFFSNKTFVWCVYYILHTV